MTARFLTLLLMLLSHGMVWANPFTNGKPATMAPPGGTPFLPQIMALQRHIHDAMTSQITALRDGHSLTPLWILLGISFAYGIFHVLAPGHGKVIVGAYFLGNRARWREGIMAGFIMAIGHTITAVAVVLVLYLLLGIGQLRLLSEARYVELIAYGAITAIGFWLLRRAWRDAPACPHCSHHHAHERHDHAPHDHAAHDHAHHHHHAAPQDKTRPRTATSLFAAASLVPCTGSMIILLFTLAQQILWAGVLAVAAIALGMGLTITAIACAAIFFHRGLLGREQAQRPWQKRTQRILGFASAGLVVATGGLLFLGTLLALLQSAG